MPRLPVVPLLVLCCVPALSAAEAVKSVEQIAAAAHQSVVVITTGGRDGKPQGLGTGFVVAADGLIATNLHVIGERPADHGASWPTASATRSPPSTPPTAPPTWPWSASTPRA